MNKQALFMLLLISINLNSKNNHLADNYKANHKNQHSLLSKKEKLMRDIELQKEEISTLNSHMEKLKRKIETEKKIFKISIMAGFVSAIIVSSCIAGICYKAHKVYKAWK